VLKGEIYFVNPLCALTQLVREYVSISGRQETRTPNPCGQPGSNRSAFHSHIFLEPLPGIAICEPDVAYESVAFLANLVSCVAMIHVDARRLGRRRIQPSPSLMGF
jgi:hypothetical protein